MTTAISWRAWDNEARQQAHAEQKIIMVFCGSSLDHWSARWLREIEAHEELCDSMNQVCVPVYLEPQDDIEFAIRAQEVLAVTSESQGWPAIVWLTPNGNPIGATPYRPLFDGEKMRGLAPMFIEVVEAWYSQREAVDADVSDMRQAWQFADSLIAANESIPIQRSIDALEAHCMHIADELEGGFGSAPRDPAFSLLPFLFMRMRDQPADSSLSKHVVKSVHALIAGGLHDHLQGGFFRASTDASWNVPFFEKRCMDQARMVQLLCEAATVCQQAVYREVALRCIGYIKDYLCLDQETGASAHGFAAESIGAGHQLINGAAYLWSYAAIENVIGKDAAAIINKRFLSDQRCFIDDEFAVMAIRDELSASEREQLPQLCQRLLGSRLERPQPQRDDTIYVSVQAAVLRALCALLKTDDDAALRAWADKLAAYLQAAVLKTSVDIASAALAVLEYLQLDNQPANAWVLARAEELRALRRDNGSLAVSAEPLFADAVMVGPDTEDYESPLALCYALWMQLDESYQADAAQLVTTYAPLIKVSPMTYAGLMTAYVRFSLISVDCNKAE